MRQPDWTKIILRPFSWLYGSITTFRNFFFDVGIFSSHKPHQFAVSVGNLTVGGTGKTPMVEYLARILLASNDVSILSRGYGRETSGYILADETATAASIGDEPMQYYQKFADKVKVAVCEKRVLGAEKLHQDFPENDVLLLDDGYQHRAIMRDLNILLNDYNRPFYKDFPFPAGRLRENRGGAKRADVVIVTKCPDISNLTDRDHITQMVRKYTRTTTPVFFAGIKYAAPVFFDQVARPLNSVKIVTGLANPVPFIQHIEAYFDVIDQIHFPDHHNYNLSDLKGLMENVKSGTFVVTTEKDMVKLKPLAETLGITDRLAYVPIEVNFGNDTEKFNNWFKNSIDRKD